MISILELNGHGYRVTPEILTNLNELCRRLNCLREAYGKPLTVTSGLRSQAQQEALIKAGKSNAPKSHHLTGEAADILDQVGLINEWCKANEPKLVEIGLWCEERQGNWQHFQIVAPRSGSRFFIP